MKKVLNILNTILDYVLGVSFIILAFISLYSLNTPYNVLVFVGFVSAAVIWFLFTYLNWKLNKLGKERRK